MSIYVLEQHHSLCLYVASFYAHSIKGKNSWHADLHCWIAGRHCVTSYLVMSLHNALLLCCDHASNFDPLPWIIIKMQCACDDCRQSPVSKATWSFVVMTWKKQNSMREYWLRSQVVVVVIAALRDHRFLIPTNGQIGSFLTWSLSNSFHPTTIWRIIQITVFKLIGCWWIIVTYHFL